MLSEADITINLLDSNDNSPIFVTSPVVFSVSEDASVGHLVGTLLVSYQLISDKLFNVVKK